MTPATVTVEVLIGERLRGTAFIDAWPIARAIARRFMDREGMPKVDKHQWEQALDWSRPFWAEAYESSVADWLDEFTLLSRVAAA